MTVFFGRKIGRESFRPISFSLGVVILGSDQRQRSSVLT
jgi:hypothetical protein